MIDKYLDQLAGLSENDEGESSAQSPAPTLVDLSKGADSSQLHNVSNVFILPLVSPPAPPLPPLHSIAIAHCFARDECPMVGWAAVSVWVCWRAACWHSSLAKQCGLMLFHHWGLLLVLSFSRSHGSFHLGWPVSLHLMLSVSTPLCVPSSARQLLARQASV